MGLAVWPIVVHLVSFCHKPASAGFFVIFGFEIFYMDLEIIFFGCIPLLISALVLGVSVYFFTKEHKERSKANFVLMIFIVLLNILALTFLIQILNGAYPSYIAHLLVALSIPLFIWQYLNFRKHR